jgi:hypothetical protein
LCGRRRPYKRNVPRPPARCKSVENRAALGWSESASATRISPCVAAMRSTARRG